MKNLPFYRPTWVEVDLGALAANLRVMRRHLKPSTKIMAAVKANAYGHGIIEVSRRLIESGVDYLGVACLDEAMILRRHQLAAPILILGAFFKSDVDEVLRQDVVVTVSDLSAAQALDKACARRKKRARIHVKVDTGMGRLGVWHEEADSFILKLCALKNLEIEGIYTHFPSADSDEAFTNSQIAAFCALVKRLSIRGVQIPIKHCANSMAVMGFKEAHFNLVRPGLALYGLTPKENLPSGLALKPVLSFKTRVAYVKRLKKGRSVSYGRTFIAQHALRLATLPVGYGDGYNRRLSNLGRVLIRGRSRPVVGVVCMDQTMVDGSAFGGVEVGEEVILIGSQGKEQIRVEEIAKLCATIPYEVVCWISPRVPRIYKN